MGEPGRGPSPRARRCGPQISVSEPPEPCQPVYGVAFERRRLAHTRATVCTVCCTGAPYELGAGRLSGTHVVTISFPAQG